MSLLSQVSLLIIPVVMGVPESPKALKGQTPDGTISIVALMRVTPGP